MYSVNNVPLDNPGLGWKLRSTSKPMLEHSKDSTVLRTRGRHGNIPLAADYGSPVIALVIETPQANLEALYTLLTAEQAWVSKTAVPGRTALVEMLSASLDGFGPADAIVDLKVMLRIPGAFWRDAAVVTSAAVAIGAATVAIGVFAGMSAPIGDATVRVKGPVTGLRVEDSGGSWWSYANPILAGTSVMFTNGRAVLSSFADSNWDDYSADMSGVTDFNGSRGRFEIAPAIIAGNPANRQGQLTIKTLTRGAGATVRVQGRGAYLV